MIALVLASNQLSTADDTGDPTPRERIKEGVEQETFGGESNPTGDPIGGGEGYSRQVAKRAYYVRDARGLIRALKEAKAGQVVYVADHVLINLRRYPRLAIPGGVTLASGRGKGRSRGALLYTTKLTTPALFVTDGRKVRITGLRISGPDRKRRKTAYEAPNSGGILVRHPDVEIDNCELSGWTHAAIYLCDAGAGHHIHHNYIHHNQRSGLGYGVCLDKSEALIEANLFDWNRHHIAGTGRPGTSYEARYNLSLENANSYSFDMHGGRDRKDGTEVAGTWINIHHNTFKVAHKLGAVLICGIPKREAKVHHNWFHHKDPDRVAWQYYGLDANMYVYRNLFGPDRKLVGTTVSVARDTAIYEGKRRIGAASKGQEFTVVGYEKGRFEVELPDSGKTERAARRRRGWIKATDAVILTLGADELRAGEKEGPVAHYTFDEGSGNIVRDQSGNGNHGTIHGKAEYAKHGEGYVLRFDGKDDFVNCGAGRSLNTNKDGTAMLWFKPDVLEGGLLTRSTGTGWHDQRLVLAFKTSGERLLLACIADGQQHLNDYFKWPKPRVWTHIAATFDGSWLTIYQDGEQVSKSRQSRKGETQILRPKVAGVPLIIGRSQGLGEKDFFKGLIGEVGIYSRALWAQEIQHHYRRAAERYR